ncbi:MAG: SGNH/GDSL hydrolase family protein [Oligoflexia bacterium]|nr:SGNH/GDSL hydrolase family protein [Oligoflexia bacterium]
MRFVMLCSLCFLMYIYLACYAVLFQPAFASSTEATKIKSYVGCYYYNPDHPILGAYQNLAYAWALDSSGDYLLLDGYYDGRFFFVTDHNFNFQRVQQLCEQSIPPGMQFYSAEAFNHFLDRYPSGIGYSVKKDAVITKYVLFGDSVSDTGGLHKWIRVFPGGVYWNGHFTNGWVWIQYLSTFSNNMPVINWSYAGMKTSRFFIAEDDSKVFNFFDYVKTKLTGNFLTELEKYLAAPTFNLSTTLHFIFLGANNYYHLMGSSFVMEQIEKESEGDAVSPIALNYANKSAEDIMTGVERLRQHGGRSFVIIALPDLGRFPTRDFYAHLMKNLSRLSHLHNRQLKKMVESYQQEHPEVKMIWVDAPFFMQQICDHPEEFAITDTTNTCLKTITFRGTREDICNNPNDYLFYDLAHPTSRIHCFLAQRIYKLLFEQHLTSSPPMDKESVYRYCVEESERILIP